MTRWLCGGLLVVLAACVVEVRAESCARLPTAPDRFGGGGVIQKIRLGRGVVPGPDRAPAAPGKLDRHGDPLPPGAVARYGTVRLRHGPAPDGLGFSPDGKVLGSVSVNVQDGIRLWDPATGKELARLNSPVTFAAFARDGSVLVIDDTRCRHWVPAPNTVRDLPEKTLPEGTQCVAAHPDLRSFAAGAPQKVVLIDLQTGKQLRELKYPAEQQVTRLTFSPDGRWLAGSGQSTGVWLWDLRTFKRVRTYKSDVDFPEYAFSPDGTRIAITGQRVRVFPTDSEELPDEYKPPEGEYLNPRFSADGKTLFAINPAGGVLRMNPVTGEAKDPAEPPDPNLHPPVAVAADGSHAAAIDQSGGIHIWDPKTGKGPAAERLPDMTRPGFSADGKTVWVLAADARLHSFDAATGKSTKVIDLPVNENSAPQSQWDPLTRRVTALIAGDDFELQMIDADSGKTLGKMAAPAGVGIPIPSFCPTDRNRVALFCQGTVSVVNAATGKPVRNITFGKPDESPPSQGAISPDGRLVAVNARPLTMFEVATGKKRFEFDGMPAAAGAVFSADGRLLAAWDSAGAVAVIDVLLGTVARRFQGNAGDQMMSVAFSPDGKRLAAAEQNGSISLFDLATGDTLGTLGRHDGPVNGVAWSPDGSRIASASHDGTVLVWDVTGKAVGKDPEVIVAGFDEAFRLLASPDAAAAQRGMDYLYRRPAEAPKQCTDRVPLPTAAPAGRITALVADLGDEDFPVRQAAVKELEAMGAEAVTPLRTAAEKSGSAEVRKLAAELLVKIENAPAKSDELRAMRAVEVLENLATPEARNVLAKWAAGPAGHRLTTESAAALARLKSRGN